MGWKCGRKERSKEGNELTNLQPHSNCALVRPSKVISKPGNDTWECGIEAAGSDEAAGVGYTRELWAVGCRNGKDEADGRGNEATNDEDTTLLVLVREMGHNDGENTRGGVGGDGE